MEMAATCTAALLRLVASQLGPGLRHRLVLGMIRRLTRLGEAGVDLGEDVGLEQALASIARMRGLLRSD